MKLKQVVNKPVMIFYKKPKYRATNTVDKHIEKNEILFILEKYSKNYNQYDVYHILTLDGTLGYVIKFPGSLKNLD
jgi:hypothetical protein